MRRFVRRSAAVVSFLAGFAFVAPAGAQPPDANQQRVRAKPKSSPAIVVIQVDDDGVCTVAPKTVTLLGKDAVAGTKGPKKVRWIYARGDGDKGKVMVKPHPGETKPGLLKLPTLSENDNEGDSSEAQDVVPGNDYYFQYVVTIEVEGDTVDCDPQICIKNNNGGCTI